MFERFNEGAIKVIMLAQEEARRLGHNFVGTEQLLLGIIGEGTSVAAETLNSCGVELKNTRIEIENLIGRGSGFVAVEIPFTPRCKRALERGWEAARKLHFNFIGPEHLLLGILNEVKSNTTSPEKNGVAAKVLEALGVDLDQLESTIQEKSKNFGNIETDAEPIQKLIKKTLYQTLQVDPEADSGIIEAAYFYLVNKHQNDEVELKSITHAWSILSDEKKRAEYDRSGRWKIP